MPHKSIDRFLLQPGRKIFVPAFRICSRSNNSYIFSIYHNPDLDGSLYDCLFLSMSDIHEFKEWESHALPVYSSLRVAPLCGFN